MMDVLSINIVTAFIVQNQVVQNNTCHDYGAHGIATPQTTSRSKNMESCLQEDSEGALYVFPLGILGRCKTLLHPCSGLVNRLDKETGVGWVNLISQPIAKLGCADDG